MEQDKSDLSKFTPEQQKAIKAWCISYSKRLDRISQGNQFKEDYSGYEQDLFESFGCYCYDE
jgi:hypothetical protein